MENGKVTNRFSSVAAAIASPTIRASVAVTWDESHQPDVDQILEAVIATAAELSKRLAGSWAG